jgi:UDP-3-O-[3-hydroxymyristoyl] N-acetylglucosamine deacetylase
MTCSGKVRPSYTLKKEVSRRGVGLFTGEDVLLTLKPLPAGSGVFLQRVDVEGSPMFPLQLSFVQGTPRCTIVGDGKVSVQTVEHLLAVLHAYNISDLKIELSGPELPIFDGSSLPFIEMIEEVGLQAFSEKEIGYLENPVYWSSGDVHLVALPSETFKISYTLHYPSSSCIGTQFFSFEVTPDSFIKEIAPCRTFSVYEEIAPLIEKGLLRGGSLDSALVIKDNQVANPEGLRLPCEMVRHKILDMIGDLYLVGFPFCAHIIAIRSGHHANNAFARELVNQLKRGSVK